MDLKSGIYSYLSGQSTLTTLADIYPSAAPPEAKSPYITYQITDRQSVHNQTGKTGLQEGVVQFDLWNFDTLNETVVADILTGLLDGQQNTTFGSVTIRSCKLNKELQSEERPMDGSSINYIYRSMIDFHFWFRET